MVSGLFQFLFVIPVGHRLREQRPARTTGFCNIEVFVIGVAVGGRGGLFDNQFVNATVRFCTPGRWWEPVKRGESKIWA